MNLSLIISIVIATLLILFVGLWLLSNTNNKEKKQEDKKNSKLQKEVELEKQELENNLVVQKINRKKIERNQLLIKVDQKLENADAKFWWKELIATQKKIITSSNNSDLQAIILQNIKDKLTDYGIEQEEIEKFCEIQKEISELKQQIQIPPK